MFKCMDCEKEGKKSSELYVLQGYLKKDPSLGPEGELIVFVRIFTCLDHFEENIAAVLKDFENFEFCKFPVELLSECKRLVSEEEQKRFIERTKRYWMHPMPRTFLEAIEMTNCSPYELYALLAYGLNLESLAKKYAGHVLFEEDWRNKGTGKLRYSLHSIKPPTFERYSKK